jgi:hypothetical protein
MSKWEEAQVAAVEFNDGAHRFCLDRIPEDDENYSPDHPYRFVWRGDPRGPNNLVIRPAYFSWELLGETVRLALDSGRLTFAEFQPFLEALLRRRT